MKILSKADGSDYKATDFVEPIAYVLAPGLAALAFLMLFIGHPYACIMLACVAGIAVFVAFSIDKYERDNAATIVVEPGVDSTPAQSWRGF